MPISYIILGVGRRSGLVGVCNVKNGNPLLAVVSLAQINPHIICKFPYAWERTLN